MGKKHKHEKHHRYKSEDERETPVIIPKLIVKFGSENTPERSLSPAAPPLSVEESDGHSSHHHRHKEKKKKKKKDKKKSHEKDREHRKKKKRRREQEHGLESEEEEEEAPELYPSAPPQLTPQNPHSQPETPEPPDSEPEPKRICRDVSSSPPRPARTCVQKPDSLAKVLEYLLVMLEKKDINNFFANPVSDTFAPGYSKIIKEPMDFSTIREMIEEGKFKTLNQFRNAFDLICNNCMTYNGPETVYFKSAKLLQRQGQRILAPERIKALAEHLPLIKDLRQEELGFEMTEELGSELTVEDEKDVSKFIEEIRTCVSRPPGKFEAIPDPLLPEEILSQAQAAARNVADKLARKGGAPMGFLRRKPETDTTTLAIITPDPVTGRSQGTEKAVNLSQLIGKVKNGTSGLMGYKEDRRNAAKAVHPLYYGAYSSHGPTHDSTFANLTKSETELVFSTYGDDVGVSYAESIKNFSLDCEYASFIVDNLLDILTGQQHSKTKQYIEEQKTIREEEKYVSESIQEKVNFESLKSLEEDGIDMSYLQDLEKKYNEKVDVKLEKTAALINNLREVQNERLSLVPSTNMSELAGPGDKERELAGEIQGNLVDIVGSGLGGGEVGGGGVAPRDLVTTASLGAVRRQLPEII